MSSLQNGQNLYALTGAGVKLEPSPLGLVTLTATDDFYFPLPMADGARSLGIHIQTTALIAGTFTVESCNFGIDGTAANVTDYDETSGGIWVPVNVAAAGYAQTVGTGWTATVLSLVKTAGTGAATICLVDPPFKRYRLKAAITTTGTCRVAVFGKD
jgi:hypothetical protein